MTLTDRLLRLAPVAAIARIAEARGLISLSSDEAGWGPTRAVTPTTYAAVGRNARKLGFESHPTVHACIRVIAEAAAAVPIQTYTRQGDGSPLVQAVTSPARKLLDAPRIGMTRNRLISLTAVHYALYGNAFWLLERSSPRSAPTAIRLIHPEDILLVNLDPLTLEVLTFEWRDRLGRRHTSFAHDLVHFPDLAGSDWLFGYPRAVTALLEMASEREANEYVRGILVNDGSPGNVALTADGTSSEDARKADKRWRERMVERNYRGSTIFLQGVKSFQPVGFNLQNLEFPSLRAISRESICSAFGVDPRLVGASSAKGNEGGLSQAGYSEARRRLYSQTVVPMLRAFESILDASFSVEWGHVYCRFDPDALSDLTETETERAERLSKLLTAGVITREEARRGVRFPERMPPGDTLVGSLSRLEYPVAAESAKAAVALAAPKDDTKALPAGGGSGSEGDDDDLPDDKGADSEDEDGEEDEGKRSTRLLIMRAAARADIALRVIKRGTVVTAEFRQEALARFDKRAVAQEKPYERAARVLFRQEREEIVGEVAKGTRAVRAEEDPFIAEALRRARKNYRPGGKYHQAWADRYRTLIGETITTSGGELAATVGVSFTLESPRVIAAIRARSTFLATKVCDYSSETVTAVLTEARRLGLGANEAAKLLESALEGLEPSRAIRIARTETIGAMNAGEFTAAQDSEGALRSKEWGGIMDDATRDTHAELIASGEKIPLDDRFSNGGLFPGDNALTPEEKINCRCTLFYYD